MQEVTDQYLPKVSWPTLDMLGRNIEPTPITMFTIYCPKKEQQPVEDASLASILFYFFVALSIIYLLLVVIREKTFRYLEGNYKWIRREWKLLDALSKDFQKVYRSVDQIKQRANPVWDSGVDLRGITRPLNEIETRWVKKAGNVASGAKRCVDDFEKLQKSSEDFLRSVLVINNPIPILDLVLGMKRSQEEINGHLVKEKKYANHVCGLLERSRIKLRSLQERPIDKNEFIISTLQFDIDLPLVLESLFKQNQNLIRGIEEQVGNMLMQVKILHGFVRDLRWLRLESEIEKAWLKEAQKILAGAEEAGEIIERVSEKAAKMRWLWLFKDWIAKRKLKKCVEDFDSGFSDLLEMKERYGFKFIKRISSKLAHSHVQQQNADDTVVLSRLAQIRTQLGEMQKRASAKVQEAPQLHASVSSLCNQLESAQQILKEQRTTKGATHSRKACFELLKQTAFDLENYMKTHLQESQASYLYEIHRIELAAGLLQRIVNAYSIKVMEDSCSVVGLEEDIHKLVHRLTGNGDNLSIISVVGMKGIGKTTLAKKIFDHGSIINHFKVRRFVTIPDQESDEIMLLKSVGNQVLKTPDEGTEKEYWIKKMQDFLKEKLYLLVVDNLSSKESWDKLKAAFPETTNGSMIMLITRYKTVALHANGKNIHQLRLRTREESWEFFTQMVHCPSDVDVERLAKKVVARTGGLPLAILRLGYILSGKRSVVNKESVTKEELSRVLERVDQGLNQTPWLETLEINKDDLQPQSVLGKCLSHFEFFPRDSEIPARRLVALWAASELVQIGDEERNNKKAYDNLLDLIDRNMIQIVERKRNRNVKTCCFPSTLRELWLRGRGNSKTARSWSLCASSDRRLAYRFNDNDDSCSHGIDGLGTNSPSACPVSIMFFDTREGNKPGEDIGNFLHKGIASGGFEELQVLDLEGVFRPQLPNSIGKLKQLTYLGLRWTFLETLPSSVGKLLQLQTLDLKHTCMRALPCSIWKLKELRHLYLDQNSPVKSMPQPTAISMKELQTLSGVFIDHEGSALIAALGKLSNLRKLGLTFKLKLEQQKELAKQIVKLTQLESLSLRSINEKSEPQGLRLKSLSTLNKLTSLYLFGKLEKPCIGEPPQSLTSLTELTLSASELTDDPMPKLGKLLKLKFLSFFSNSYKGKYMACGRDSFPKLLVLQLWNLDNLEELVLEVGAMQKLRELEIRSCKNLEVSFGLTNLQTLQELKLTNMPEKYAADVENVFAAAADQPPSSSIHSPAIKIRNN